MAKTPSTKTKTKAPAKKAAAKPAQAKTDKRTEHLHEIIVTHHAGAAEGTVKVNGAIASVFSRQEAKDGKGNSQVRDRRPYPHFWAADGDSITEETYGNITFEIRKTDRTRSA